MVLLQSLDDVLLLFLGELALSIVEHLVKQDLVAKSLDLLFLLFLQGSSLFHDDSGYQVRLDDIDSLLKVLAVLGITWQT